MLVYRAFKGLTLANTDNGTDMSSFEFCCKLAALS
jgi:hypothetical protein